MATLWQKTKQGTWYITYRENGRQKVRSLHTTSRRRAVRLRNDIEGLLEAGCEAHVVVADHLPVERKNPTVAAFWSELLVWAQIHRSRSTVDEYKSWFQQVVSFCGAKHMGDITQKDIETFKRSRLRQGLRKPKGVGLDPVSINNGLKTLCAIWNHGIKLGLLEGDNPVAKVERLRIVESADRNYLDKEQIDRLLKAAQEYSKIKHVKRNEARNVCLAIALMALAGLRKREVCYARWEWIRWDPRILCVDNHEEFVTKNRKSRMISLSRQLVEILEPHALESGYILEDVRSSDKKAEYRADFKKAFGRVCELSGIWTTPHQLRHSFATRHAIVGTSLHVIAGWLGHSTTWVTQRYAHFQTTYNAAADNI